MPALNPALVISEASEPRTFLDRAQAGDEEGEDAPEAQKVDAMRALDALAGELAVENVRGGADRQRAAWATISLVPTGAGTGRPPSGHGH